MILIAPLMLLGACGRLDSIPYHPPHTAESWLMIQPYIQVRLAGLAVIIVQPSTSFIVYLLGVLTIGVGIVFLRHQQGQHARRWWGIALLLWGMEALLAGTSYEAFSYQIKCAGREACVWTSTCEMLYLLLSVASVDAMLVAVAYSCTEGSQRVILLIYASANLALYSALLLVGAMIPIQFLVSFELLIVFTAPTILFLLVLNGWRYSKYKQRLDLVLLLTWIWLVITLAAYFAYLLLGITPALWKSGIWFSENDVLHIGLIIWMLYLALVVAKELRDKPNIALASPLI